MGRLPFRTTAAAALVVVLTLAVLAAEQRRPFPKAHQYSPDRLRQALGPADAATIGAEAAHLRTLTAPLLVPREPGTASHEVCCSK